MLSPYAELNCTRHAIIKFTNENPESQHNSRDREKKESDRRTGAGSATTNFMAVCQFHGSAEVENHIAETKI
jgi:hypothetical protein